MSEIFKRMRDYYCGFCGKPNGDSNYYDWEDGFQFCCEECYETHMRHTGRGKKDDA